MSFTVDSNNPNYKSVNGLLLTKDGTTLVKGVKDNVTIPDSVTIIGTYAFYYYIRLTSITIPNSVTSIGYAAFCNCYGLTSVTIPDSVTSIGDFAFAACDGLKSVTIGNGVTYIGNSAFSSCFYLAVFDFHNHQSVPQLASTSAFTSTPSTKKIVVPDNLYESWKTATNWSSTTNNIVSSIIRYSDYINT